MVGGKLFFSVVILLLCAQFVLSIGVSPADSYVTYVPKSGIDAEFIINFRSTEVPPGIASIEVIDGDALTVYIIKYQEGWSGLNKSEVEEYVTIDKTSFDFSKGGNKVVIKLKIPPYAPIYGPHEFGIKATEVPPSAGGISVGTAVIHRVKIDAPFPGQYAEINNFGITNINQGELSKLYWNVIGRSEQETTGYADLEIFSSEGVSVYRKNLGFFSVGRHELFPEAGKEEEVLPTSDFIPGRYNAVLTIKFADMTRSSSVYFNVGTESVSLENYTPVNLTTGEINEVVVVVKNLWNGEFQNTYALINVSGIIATTPSSVLSPFGVLELKQFVDTRNLPEGTYESNIIVNFGSNKMNFPASFNIVNKTLPIIPKEDIDLTKYYLIGAAVIVLIVLSVWFFFRKKKNKGKESGEEEIKKTEMSNNLDTVSSSSVVKKTRSKK